jgi:glucose-6-phosphate isomerase
MTSIASLLHRFDPETGAVDGVRGISKRLADLRGTFADRAAYERALQEGNPVVYTVSTVTPGEGTGALHYGLGILFPGIVGDEYYMTRGHYHSMRAAAEVYVGLKGEGRMVLEDDNTGNSRIVELLPDSIVYVPGHTAHRTVNVGSTPLVYLGIYPADAGHDYGEIAQRNFRMMIIKKNGKPLAMARDDYLLERNH